MRRRSGQSFAETDAKKSIRQLLLQASVGLGRVSLCFMTLPESNALDLKILKPVLGSAILINRDKAVLEEAARSISTIPLLKVTLREDDAWDYLRDEYPHDGLADVTYLDFCGGGLRDEPYLKQLAALDNYFLRHALKKNQAFIFAWTYMPRDAGVKSYDDALQHIHVDKHNLQRLSQLAGLPRRSYIIRLLLQSVLKKHGQRAKIFEHILYKDTMNALILVFCKGADPQCTVQLLDPGSDMLVNDDYTYYSENGVERRSLVGP